MKYQLCILSNIFKSKILKWLIIFIILLTTYLLITVPLSKGPGFNQTTITNLLTLTHFEDNSFMIVLLNTFQILLTIYITYIMYNYEYKASIEFIVLRMNEIKRNFYKLLVTILFVLLLRISYYVYIYLFTHELVDLTHTIFSDNIIHYLIIVVVSYVILLINQRIID